MDIRTDVDGSIATIKVDGKLTALTAPELQQCIDELPGSARDVELDLSGVDYVASAGLRVFMAASKLAVRRGGKLRILHPAPQVTDVLEVTGLATILSIEQ